MLVGSILGKRHDALIEYFKNDTLKQELDKVSDDEDDNLDDIPSEDIIMDHLPEILSTLVLLVGKFKTKKKIPVFVKCQYSVQAVVSKSNSNAIQQLFGRPSLQSANLES